MIFSTVKRLAGDILSVGRNKIWIDPDSINEIRGAQTRSDIQQFIDKGLIKKHAAPGRGSARKKERHGEGHRRGTIIPQKESWMEKVRAQRKLLVMLLSSGVLKKDQKWVVYRKVKSGLFRNKRAMLSYLQDGGLIAKDYVMPKAQFTRAEKPKPAPKAKVEGKPKSQDKKPGAKKADQPKQNTEQLKTRVEAPKSEEKKAQEKTMAAQTANKPPHHAHTDSEKRHHDKKGEI